MTSLAPGGGDEVVLHLLALAGAQQAVVDEHAGQTITDGALHECGGHGGVHTAGQRADRVAVADLLAHALDELLGDVGGGPVLLQTRDVGEEAGEHLLAVRRVQHLGVVLDAGHALLGALEGGHRRASGGRGGGEAPRGLGHGVAVAHPDLVGVLEALVQHAGVDGEVGAAVLAAARGGDGAAELLRHDLEAVADAEDGQAQLQDLRVRGGRTVSVDGGGPAGEDEGSGVLLAHLVGGDGVGHDLGVDAGLAHATRDELRVLGTEVHDEDGAVLSLDRLRHGV